MCADGLSLAESVKNQLRNQFTEELKVFKIRQEREKAEEEARKAKEEMWKMEAERRRLEAEIEAAQREIEEMNEESRRREAEAERQELIRIYGDPDEILQEATAPPRPAPPSTIPSSEPNIASPPYTSRREPLQSSYQPVNDNSPIVTPRHNKPGKMNYTPAQKVYINFEALFKVILAEENSKPASSKSSSSNKDDEIANLENKLTEMKSKVERISLNNERLESKVERFTSCPICEEEVILFHTGLDYMI